MSAFALQVVIVGAFFYGLYWVIRKAVAAGQVDAQRKLDSEAAAPRDATRVGRN